MAIKAVHSTLPVATTFTNSKGETAKFFLKNNPWKVFSNELFYPKAFQYCIICGDARFSAEEWSTMVTNRIGSTTTCDKESCLERDLDVARMIPQKHLIMTEKDQGRIQGNLGREFFEEVDEARSEAELSPELLKKLEELPIEERMNEISRLYFDHAAKNNIQLGKFMADTKDSFLKALVAFRQKVYH